MTGVLEITAKKWYYTLADSPFVPKGVNLSRF